jgi:hypothetical protein
MSVATSARFQSAQDWMALLVPFQDRREKKVVLLRRIVPGPAPSPVELHSAPALQPPRAAEPVRPRRAEPAALGTDLSRLNLISGFISGWLIDARSGEVLAGDCRDDRIAGWQSTQLCLARANLAAIEAMEPAEAIEDIMVAIGREIHLIRPLARSPKHFLCVVMDREGANPALARVQLRRVEQSLVQ